MRSVRKNRTKLGSANAAVGTLLSTGIAFVAASIAANAQAPATPSATPTAPASTQTAPVAPTPAAPSYTLTGLIDAYYGYNFNNPYYKSGGETSITGPGNATTGRNFDYKNNQFALGLAELNIVKAATDSSRVGFKVSLGYGPTIDLLTSPGDSDNKNILQAFGTLLLPVGGKDLTVNAGKFVTFIGQEVVEPSANWSYSHSLLYQYFEPVYHSGVSAGYSFTPTVTGTVYVLNGWNNVSFDTNDNKALGASFAIAPASAKYSLLLNGLTSNEPSTALYDTVAFPSYIAPDKSKTVLEPILTWNFSPALTGVLDANFDFGKYEIEETSGNTLSINDKSWASYGFAGYLHYALKSGNAVTVRAEYFDDDKGILLGTGDGSKQDGGEVSLTYSIKAAILPNAETRFEFRHDYMKQAGAFIDDNGHATKKNQDTVGISEMFSF